jgi:glutamate dehydrogenase (NAD(P)+)
MTKAPIVIQGFGNVGSCCARILHESGRKITAVSDVHGGVYNPAGLNIPKLMKHVEKTGSVKGFTGAREITNNKLLQLPCTFLIPAALGGQITAKNADRIKAQVVVEAANGPVTPAADRILKRNKVLVVPDILANAGGVTVSYFEWVQSLQAYFWSEEEIIQRLEQVLHDAFEEVIGIMKQRRVDMRLAAMMLGVSRVAEAVEARGLYP